ncbi:vWA domain-containing protein [Pedococcus sp. 5OH_020]|uniref:vWA domain-containing protein n=1 Tax=Pedococcus sp. 5OH_020 TaxID=2989814 RepID=UPI0022E9AE80|nr:VWA domain-containing protein [Pedococcus sp. 5OH_020]
MSTATAHAPDEVLLAFARAVRAAGVAVTADRERTYLEAAAQVGLAEAQTYWAGRATLCGSPADLERYDQVYAAWFGLDRVSRRSARDRDHPLTQASVEPAGTDGTGPVDVEEDETVRARASATEVLRHRDLASLSAAERARLATLFASLRPRAPRRAAARRAPARRGAVDARRTLRAQLRRFGEPAPLQWRRRATRPRRLVLLVDVSGSMSGYADALLRLAHAYAAQGLPVEVFTLGTRLTHVTRALRQRDPERALVACGAVVPDWSGGTRLAQGLGAFLDRWGRRGMARGAVVVVFSDGWEREAPQALGEQMRRLRGLAHRVVWVNPHRGKPGYLPVQQGIVAALPYIDDFLAGHSMATFEELVEVVAHA